jgi:hypothetical protein
MRYFNNSFWRMIMGLAIVLVMGVAFLVVLQIYNLDKTSSENYVAVPAGER